MADYLFIYTVASGSGPAHPAQCCNPPKRTASFWVLRQHLLALHNHPHHFIEWSISSHQGVGWQIRRILNMQHRAGELATTHAGAYIIRLIMQVQKMKARHEKHRKNDAERLIIWSEDKARLALSSAGGQHTAVAVASKQRATDYPRHQPVDTKIRSSRSPRRRPAKGQAVKWCLGGAQEAIRQNVLIVWYQEWGTAFQDDALYIHTLDKDRAASVGQHRENYIEFFRRFVCDANDVEN
ncbi:hypothetical protein EDD36DRAFT_486657 [Exophiala viscosa]|uniref:Uncharacterized protein n=1 Tax=Exophiala viscosa TaxID=2486360 RepID=A0AAN6IDH4_9EURO|nr:hypothetical protein EDD36DRAFT_486657 [Exophiala viscosa]